MGDPAAIAALERELSHPDWRVRRAAASALSQWARRPSTRRELAICQQDYYTAVRRACREALASANVKKPAKR
jgi:HEAT repeat protein